MKLMAQIEINSDGILRQMEKVRDANLKARQEMDVLDNMLRELKITEQLLTKPM